MASESYSCNLYPNNETFIKQFKANVK